MTDFFILIKSTVSASSKGFNPCFKRTLHKIPNPAVSTPFDVIWRNVETTARKELGQQQRLETKYPEWPMES